MSKDDKIKELEIKVIKLETEKDLLMKLLLETKVSTCPMPFYSDPVYTPWIISSGSELSNLKQTLTRN